MAKLTPKEFQEKHARRLKASLSDIKAGVSRVTENPMEKAANKSEKMKERLVAAIDSGKWARGLRSVSLDDWKSQLINKGIPRISAGIDAAAPKVEAFAEKLLPYIDEGVAKVKSMPDLTLEDSISRMSEFIRHMANFKK